MSDANTIRVVLLLEGKRYEVDIERAEAKTRGFGGEAQKVAAQTGALTTALRGAAAGFGLMAAIDVAKALSANGQAFEKIEQSLDATTMTAEGTRREFAFIVSESDRLGARIIALGEEYSDLTAATRGTRLEGQATRDIFSSVIEAGTKLNKSQQELGSMLNTVTKIVNKGVASQEEWRQSLSEKLPGAAQATARALGMTTQELDKLIERGEVTAEQLLPALAQGLRETFNTDAQMRVEGTASSFARLSNEIKLAADALVSGPLNGLLTGGADAISAPLRFVREGGLYGYMARRGGTTTDGRYYEFSGGKVLDYETMERFSPWPYQGPSRELFDTSRFLQPYMPQPQARPTGPDAPFVELPQLTEKQEQRLELLQEEFQLQQLVTNEQKAVYQITQGRYADESKQIKDQILANAKLRDQVEARAKSEREQASASKAAGSEAERLSREAQREAEQQQRATAEKAASIDEMIQRRELEVALIGKTDAAERFAIERQLGLYDELSEAQLTQLELLAQRQSAAEQSLRTEREQKQELRERLELEQRLRREMDRQIRQDPRAAAFGIRSLEDLESRMDPMKAAALDLGEVLNSSFSRAGDSIADMTARMILFGETGDLSVKRIAQALVQDMLTGLIKVGLQMVVNWGISKVFGTTATATAAAQASALTTAWAPAALSASIATLGGAGAIGLATYLGGLGTATAVAAATSAAGGGAAIGAGKEYGGYTMPGRAHPVVEAGKPELLEQDGKFYLLPGSRGGRVYPSRAGGAGGGGLQVNINQVPDSLSPRVRQQGDVLTVDMLPAIYEQAAIVTDQRIGAGIMNGRSVAGRSIGRKYGVQAGAMR